MTMPIIDDEETRQLILKKTWCHGQAVLPLYSIMLLVWWYHLESPSFVLVEAAFALGIWSWYSFRAVFRIMGSRNNDSAFAGGAAIRNQQRDETDINIRSADGADADGAHSFHYPKLCALGICAMISHLSIFIIAIPDCKVDTMHMLFSISSGLLFIETGAFLVVVTSLREEILPLHNTTSPHYIIRRAL